MIAVAALLLFPPHELPKMLRTLAKFWGQISSTADEFRDTIMHADGVDELQELVKGTANEVRKVEGDARRELMKARAQMRKAQQKLVKAGRAHEEIRKRDLGEEDAAEGDEDEDDDAKGGFASASKAQPVAATVGTASPEPESAPEPEASASSTFHPPTQPPDSSSHAEASSGENKKDANQGAA